MKKIQIRKPDVKGAVHKLKNLKKVFLDKILKILKKNLKKI